MAGKDIGKVTSAMRSYGSKSKTAGDRIAKIDLASVAGKVGEALPGSTAGGAASSCVLNQDIPDWGEAIAAQGHKVASADASYTANDSELSDVLGQVMPDGSGGGH